ncbi:MAG: elongation factor G [Lentisphaeria bacterium]
MKNCPVEKIRNFAVTGHAAAGKTTLCDLMLFKAKAVGRLGSVDQKTSVSDFRAEEQERKHSLYSAPLNCAWNGCHFFFTDSPGAADFCGEATAAQAVADLVLLVVDATAGIGPSTLRSWKQAKAAGQPRAIFINGLDKDTANFAKVLGEIQEAWGATNCLPFALPDGEKAAFKGVLCALSKEASGAAAKARSAVLDAVAESDEALMAKYLEGQELSEEEESVGLHRAVRSGDIVPVYCGSAAKDLGITELMDGLIRFCPNPLEGGPVPLKEGGLPRQGADAPAAMALVFKTLSDPFIGQLSYFRVYAGQFTPDAEVFNVTRGSKERWGTLNHVNGKEQTVVESAGPGEIIAVAKLKATHINDTLSGKHVTQQFPPVAFPLPTVSCAIHAVKTGEDEKIAAGIHRIMEEDPTIKLERNGETHETLLSGMGDQHLHNIAHRLKTTLKVEMELKTPKVPYRETITASGSHVYRHKKQTGGHGQFAEVHLRLDPLHTAEYVFENEVVGGNIPKNFIPAVEKGVLEAKDRGPLAGCKVINFKAAVFDGKYHPVDSSEMAFKVAARGAFRGAMAAAKPILLEPIMKLKISFPEAYMGDITGDLNTRRGRILGMDREDGAQVVFAEVPLAETFTYSSQLRSLTQGRGSFEMHYDRYEPVPSIVSKQIQEAAAKHHVEEEE